MPPFVSAIRVRNREKQETVGHPLLQHADSILREGAARVSDTDHILRTGSRILRCRVASFSGDLGLGFCVGLVEFLPLTDGNWISVRLIHGRVACFGLPHRLLVASLYIVDGRAGCGA